MNNITPPHAHADAVSRAHELLAQGERLLDQGRIREAKEQLLESVRLDPASAAARNKLGVCYARLEQWENAREQFLEALRLDPTYAPAHSNMGNLHREAGRLDDAVSSYLEALRHDPEYHIAYHNLGVVYKQQGKISEAVSLLKRAQRLEKVWLRQQARERGGLAASHSAWVWLIVIAVIAYLLLR